MKQIRHRIGELTVFQKADDGYINATQLCKAYEQKTGLKKTPNNWFETNRANALLELVRSDIGIPISQLFIVQRSNSLRYNQGTWIHPDLATPFASWLSPEFELKVSRWVQEWMRTGINPVANYTTVNTSVVPIDEPSLEEINLVFSGINSLGINPVLVESSKLTAISVAIPRLKAVAEEGKRLVSSQMTLEEIPVSPTRLGELIAQKHGLKSVPTPQNINKALEECGLQVKQFHSSNAKKKSKYVWELTDIGKEFAQLQMDTAKTHAKTVFCIRWFTCTIPVIENLLLP